MTPLNSILILLVAFLAVFCEAAFSGFRNLLGAQIDLLPALVVYAALSTGLVTIWQLLVMSVGGMIATPALFLLFDWFDGIFTYRRATETSFRPDREIRRSRR